MGKFYEIQIYLCKAGCRDFLRTVSYQFIFVAFQLQNITHQRFRPDAQRLCLIPEMLRYLRRVSANLFHPDGFRKKPFNLYITIGVYRLHAVDVGIGKDLPDLVHLFLNR